MNSTKIFNTIAYTILTLFSIACILPILNVIALSLSGAQIAVALLPKNTTLYSYYVVLSEIAFLRSMFWSAFITVVGSLFTATLMFFAAYPLSKERCPHRRVFMMFFIINMLFSGGVVANFLWFKQLGILDTPLALFLPFGVQAYYLILFKAYLEGIPESLEEAAEIDGATKMGILFRIIMPLSVPVIITVLLFLAVGNWNNYTHALYYLPTKHEYYPLSMYILNYIHGSAINDYRGDLKKALHKDNIEAAMIILSILPIIIPYPYLMKFFRKGVAVGAVKG